MISLFPWQCMSRTMEINYTQIFGIADINYKQNLGSWYKGKPFQKVVLEK